MPVEHDIKELLFTEIEKAYWKQPLNQKDFCLKYNVPKNTVTKVLTRNYDGVSINRAMFILDQMNKKLVVRLITKSY